MRLIPSLIIPEIPQECSKTSMGLGLSFIRDHVHCLRQDLPLAHTQTEVKPPKGVPAAMIQSIHLRLQISQCPTSRASTLKRKRKRKRNGGGASNYHDIHDDNVLEINEPGHNGLDLHALPFSVATENEVLSNEDMSVKRIPQQTPQMVSFKDMVKLLDMSLRGMISTPKRTCITEQLPSNTFLHPNLGQLLPAVFSPGYHEVSPLTWRTCIEND